MAKAKTGKTLPLSHLDDKPAVRNYGPMTAKGQPKSSKTKKTTKKTTKKGE